MNWDAIGAIGEIVGATAVVTTILYFAGQTRQASRNHAAQAPQSTSDGTRNWFSSMRQDPEFTALKLPRPADNTGRWSVVGVCPPPLFSRRP